MVKRIVTERVTAQRTVIEKSSDDDFTFQAKMASDGSGKIELSCTCCEGGMPGDPGHEEWERRAMESLGLDPAMIYPADETGK